MGKDLNVGNQHGEKAQQYTKVLATISAALLLSLSSCDSAQKGYESGSTKIDIEVATSNITSLIEAYNSYFDVYEHYQADLITLQRVGDIKGYQNTLEKSTELGKTIMKIEKEIDKKGNKLFKLTKKYHKGKIKSSESRIRSTQSSISTTNSPQNPERLSRRTFKEYQHTYHLK